jgi:hypothetical protein
MTVAFPFLKEYQQVWPVRSYLFTHFKNRVDRASGQVSPDESELSEPPADTDNDKAGKPKSKVKIRKVHQRKGKSAAKDNNIEKE